MPLTEKEALALYSRLPKDSYVKKKDNTVSLNANTLEKDLKTLRLALLEHRAPVIDDKEPRVRLVLPVDFTDKTVVDEEIIAKGVDTARAALKILSYRPNQSTRTMMKRLNTTSAHHQIIIDALHRLQENVAQLGSTENKLKELKLFNAAMARLVTKGLEYKNKKTAQNALDVMRGMLYTMDIATDDYCIVEKNEQSKSTMVHHVSHMRFDKEDPKGCWDIDKNPIWLEEAAQQITEGRDNWFKTFISDHLDEIRTRSFQPSNRFLPNPVNACSETTMLFGRNGELIAQQSATSMGITEPYDIKHEKERKKLTAHAHQMLVNETRITQEVNAFLSHWGMLYEKGDALSIPLLHHTLIADAAAAADSSKSKDPISMKRAANDELRSFLNSHHLLKGSDNKYFWQEKNALMLPTEQEVKINLLEINHSVNVWTWFSRARENDLTDLRALLRHGEDLYGRYSKKLGASVDHQKELQTVLTFLKSPDQSPLTSFKPVPDAVKTALKSLTEALMDDNKNLPGTKEQRANLALSLNAAVEVKCACHETYGGHWLRRVDAWSEAVVKPKAGLIGRFFDGVIKAGTGTLSILGQIVRMPVQLIQKKNTFFERENIHIAAVTQLLGETIGVHQGGCMSAVDRKGQIDELVRGLINQLLEKKCITGIQDDTGVKKQFAQNYGLTRTRHDRAFMNTGASGTNDSETEGLSSDINLISAHEPKEMKELFGKMVTLRKGGGYSSKSEDKNPYVPLNEKAINSHSPQMKQKQGFQKAKGDSQDDNKDIVSDPGSIVPTSLGVTH